KGVFGVNVAHLWNEGKKIRGWMEAIIKGVNEGWIQPHVGKSFKFDNVGDAHTYIEDRRNIGKVVLVIGEW
ncbi:zinc-binding dehydrogenase, partial [candidate division KSB1 bacterium]|nr:zinc-binding dehydrogenase [candidate division KSB1 bacterium]